MANDFELGDFVFFPPNFASLVAQRLKHLPPVRETQVRSLGQEDPLEKEMATHSSILAWKITWTEKPGRLQSMGSQMSQTQLSDEQQHSIGDGTPVGTHEETHSVSRPTLSLLPLTVPPL